MLLPESFCDKFILVRNSESHTQISDLYEPREAAKLKKNLHFERAAKSAANSQEGRTYINYRINDVL